MVGPFAELRGGRRDMGRISTFFVAPRRRVVKTGDCLIDILLASVYWVVNTKPSKLDRDMMIKYRYPNRDSS